MNQRANVSSIDALKDFRARLLVYLTKARPALEEARAEVARTRQWLVSEKRAYWETEVRRRYKALEEARQALFSSRVSHLHQSTLDYQKMVQKAQRSLDEAEAKLRLVKKRARQFDSQVEPLLKQLQVLHGVLVNHMPKGAAFLAQSIDTLEAYAEVAPPAAGSPETRPASEAAAAPVPAAEPGAEVARTGPGSASTS